MTGQQMRDREPFSKGEEDGKGKKMRMDLFRININILHFPIRVLEENLMWWW